MNDINIYLSIYIFIVEDKKRSQRIYVCSLPSFSSEVTAFLAVKKQAIYFFYHVNTKKHWIKPKTFCSPIDMPNTASYDKKTKKKKNYLVGDYLVGGLVKKTFFCFSLSIMRNYNQELNILDGGRQWLPKLNGNYFWV